MFELAAYRRCMAINEWWANEPDQTFWMEATDREVLGDDLRAPKGGSADQPVWHYDLVSLTRPGDIVFHYHTTLFDRPALVGWSEVVGPLREELHAWVGHAGPGGSTEEKPNWIMPLSGIHWFDEPIGIGALTEIRAEVLDVRARSRLGARGRRTSPSTATAPIISAPHRRTSQSSPANSLTCSISGSASTSTLTSRARPQSGAAAARGLSTTPNDGSPSSNTRSRGPRRSKRHSARPTSKCSASPTTCV